VGRVAIQAFHDLLEEERNKALRRAGEHHEVISGRRTPDLTLTLDHGLTRVDPAVRRRLGVSIPASVILHAAAAGALVIVPLLVGDSHPQPRGVRAFFVEPITAPPPPPPPPPPAPRGSAVARRAPKATEAAPLGLTAPIAVPTEVQPEEGLDLGGIGGGVAGGVEGGVPGGVVGGVVGGLPDAMPPPPPARPVRVGGDIREPRKVVDVAPVYPEVAMKAGVQGVVIIEATIDGNGRVTNATVLKGLPMLDEAALEAVRRWIYTPTLLDGVPTPVIMTVTVRFRLKTGASRGPAPR
jgi:protein TonB